MTSSPAPDPTAARDASAETEPANAAEGTDNSTEQPGGSSLRQMLEAIACLAIAVIVFRAFVLEGYIISTGSMAPCLLGYHKRVQCPDCGFAFAFGVSDAYRRDPAAQVAECPNCRITSIDVSQVPRNDGDQLLVLKNAWLTEFAPFVKSVGPDRWDVVVFLNPNDSSQAYVKRAIGLPGESIQIRDGDIFINGQRQRKSIETQRAMRVPVFDNDFPSQSQHWLSPWSNSSDHWQPAGRGFVAARNATSDAGFAWLTYRHWVQSPRPPGRTLFELVESETRPVSDRYGYNRHSAQVDHVDAHDLMLAARFDHGAESGPIAATIRNRGDFVVCLIDPTTDTLTVLLFTAGDTTPLDTVLRRELNGTPTPHRIGAQAAIDLQWPLDLEFSVFDRQAIVSVNGTVMIQQPLPEPRTGINGFNTDDPDFNYSIAGQTTSPETPLPVTPVGIGVLNGTVRVDSLRVFRDVHYTAEAGQHATSNPLQLGDDQFFMLGDNSPVSLDSRSWPDPVVPRRLLVGKPLVVHLPSRPGRLRMGDRVSHIRVPDFSRMRYIR